MSDFDLKNSYAITTNIDDIDNHRFINIINPKTESFYFIAKEIAKVLGYSHPQNLITILNSREYKVCDYHTLNDIKDLESCLEHEMSPRGMTILNLDGVKVACRSDDIQSTYFREEILPVIESNIRSIFNKNKANNSLDKILEKLDLQTLQLEKQALQFENRILNLKQELMDELQVKVEFKGYSVKIPNSCYDIAQYVSYFNNEYNRSVTKLKVHRSLQEAELINYKNIPTKTGIELELVGIESIPIIHSNNNTGKSIKTVIYLNQLDIIDDIVLNYLMRNSH